MLSVAGVGRRASEGRRTRRPATRGLRRGARGGVAAQAAARLGTSCPVWACSVGGLGEDQRDRLDREVAALTSHSSFCSISAPASRITAASLGKIPTTSVRRPISWLTRSSGLVERSLVQCSGGRRKRQAGPLRPLEQLADLRRHGAEPLEHVRDALLGVLVALSVEDLAERRRDQLALVAAAVHDQSLKKWTVQRCHGQPARERSRPSAPRAGRRSPGAPRTARAA